MKSANEEFIEKLKIELSKSYDETREKKEEIKDLEKWKKISYLLANKKPLKTIKEELPLRPKARSRKAYDDLIREYGLTYNLVKVFDMPNEIRDFFANDRNSKKPKYRPIVKFFSQSDIYNKYPYYAYSLNDLVKVMNKLRD